MRPALLFLLACQSCFSANPAAEVNPLIGTAGEGQTYPSTGVPFGMTQWTPQTRDGEAKCVAPYYYADTKIQGFRGSHFLSGSCTQDYGSVTLMPGTGKMKTSSNERASTFQHAREKALPYRYDVVLDDSGVAVSLTGASHTGFLEFRFPAAQEAWIVLQVNSRKGEGEVHIDPAKREIYGNNPAHRLYAGVGQPAGFSGYFVARFDHAFQTSGQWDGPGAWVGFPSATGEVVRVKVGTSFTSVEEARKNLEAEIPGWDFNATATAAERIWNETLSRIDIGAAPEARRRVFYTALYHAYLTPRAFSDVSGTYPRFAGSYQTEVAKDFVYYCDFSLWDTYRSLHPLLTIIDPAHTSDMVRSLMTKAQQGGWLPMYPAWNNYTQEMIGDHAIVTIVDAYMKGTRGFDVEEAYRLMRRNATESPATFEEYAGGRGRRALISYMKYGFVPLEDPVAEAFHKGEQVSRTLEYAFDDFVLAQLAERLGKKEDAAMFRKRAQWYRNVIDPETGFARGRHADGTWDSPFDPAGNYRYITEGLPFQYTFFVPQDVEGLIQVTGGREKFNAKLDALFAGKHYNHGNEPSHHIAYLYDWSGEPWKTQEHVRRVMDEEYLDQPAGIAGNDDCGQMSAWYVMSALGFYPVAPGTTNYQIGTPLFDSATIHLSGGKTFRIRAAGALSGKLYIQSAKLNGKPITRTFLRHEEIAAGGELVFTMGTAPNKTWGAGKNDAPLSMTAVR